VDTGEGEDVSRCKHVVDTKYDFRVECGEPASGRLCDAHRKIIHGIANAIHADAVSLVRLADKVLVTEVYPP